MDIRFMAKNVEVPADLKDYMIKKFSRMEKFFPQISGQILIKMVRDTYIAEVTANVKGVIMRGEERDLEPGLAGILSAGLKCSMFIALSLFVIFPSQLSLRIRGACQRIHDIFQADSPEASDGRRSG